jgi:hypothetical protein
MTVFLLVMASSKAPYLALNILRVPLDALLSSLRKSDLQDVSQVVGSLCRRTLTMTQAATAVFHICEDFGTNFKVIFNAEKTKCIAFNMTKFVISKILTPVFLVDGKFIENVTQWHHLGHLISAFHTDDMTKVRVILLDK